ncbi:YcxB family protein [Clostridium nigeriense]|uniref:YcxB family protein n=1 Tax=Clostridium nigeriense TaxID=1805470 RepID=UPI003D33480F
MFESTGVVNEEIVRTFKSGVLPSATEFFFRTMIFICMGFGILSIFMTENKVFLLSFSLLTIIFITEYFYIINKVIKICIQRMEESVGKKESKYNVYFDEEGAIVNNLDTGVKSHMKYDVFKRFAETSNAYALFTKSNEIIVIFKECMNKSEVDEFKGFIKEKCQLK